LSQLSSSYSSSSSSHPHDVGAGVFLTRRGVLVGARVGAFVGFLVGARVGAWVGGFCVGAGVTTPDKVTKVLVGALVGEGVVVRACQFFHQVAKS
jgi:hypothetical protein